MFIATEQNLTTSLESGTYFLRPNMTPQQIVTSLLVSHQVAIAIGLRPSLRLEQITAKLQTVDGLTMDVKAFYDEVEHPPASLLADYPWLSAVLPKGASLEGFLGAATYTVPPDVTADEFVRMLLDAWHQQVGADLMNVPAARGMTFYQVLSLASIVERETGNDPDRAKIAGVYVNRAKPNHETAGFLGSDPTVFYVNDTLKLAAMPFSQWQSYLFWAPLPKGTTLPADLPADLAGYNTYTSKGLIPGPICTPSVASIKAALNPDTSGGYLLLPGDEGRHDRVRQDLCRAPEEHPEVRPVSGPDWPEPADFGGPPSPADRERWDAADRAARPERLARLRARMAGAGVDAYLGVRAEHSRYLTGLVLGDGEEKVAGASGWFVVSPAEVVLFADSRYTIQARREATDARIEPVYGDLGSRWPEILASLGRGEGPGLTRSALVGRVAVEAGFVSHATWLELAAAAPGVELVAAQSDGAPGRPGVGWVEADRAGQGTGRARTGRRRLRRGGPGPGQPPAGDPPRGDRDGAGLAARGPDPDRWRGRPGLRRGLPGRS